MSRILKRKKLTGNRKLTTALLIIAGTTYIYGKELKPLPILAKKINEEKTKDSPVMDEEIKWLWPLSSKRKSFDPKDEGVWSVDPPPIPEPEYAVNDEIPAIHDPDGKTDDEDIYTEILERKWDEVQKKWVVIGLKDKDKNGFADIYEEDEDFDGDGIKNKDDENWTLNKDTPNNHFEQTKGLGYVNSANLVALLSKQWNADDIKTSLYHENITKYDSGMSKLLVNTDILNITALKKYNEEYNQKNGTTTSFQNSAVMEEKLGVLGQNHDTVYNDFTQTSSNIVSFVDVNDETDSQYKHIEDENSIIKGIMVNKGKINFNGHYGQSLTGAVKEAELYNYGIINGFDNSSGITAAQYATAEISTLYNYGLLTVEDKSNPTNAGIEVQAISHFYENNQKGEFYNYGVIIGKMDQGGNATGQFAYSRGQSNFSLYNYGEIELYNYGQPTSNDLGHTSDNAGQKSYGQDVNNNLYNYGNINILSETYYSDGLKHRANYGQLGTGFNGSSQVSNEIFNYGNISIKDTTHEDEHINNKGFNYGQSGVAINNGTGEKSKNQLYNYGKINIEAINDRTYSFGQYIAGAGGATSSNVEISQAYNYGDIVIKSGFQGIGQYSIGWGTGYFNSELFNYGRISVQGKEAFGQTGAGYNTVANNYGLIRVKGEDYRTAGVHVWAGGKGFNFGVIEVDNTGLAKENMGTGMWAEGDRSEVFNYGSIYVTEITGDVINGIDSAYMRGTDGGKVYNYGHLELKNSLDTLVIGEGTASSTSSSYKSAGDFELKGEMQIMAEAGKGENYTKENFITAGGEISGLENLSSSGVYEISTVIKNENGENIADIQMTKTKNIENLENNKNTKRMITQLNLDNAIYGENSEFALENKEFSDTVTRILATGGSLEQFFGVEYANLNAQILNAGEELLQNQEKLHRAEGAYVSGQGNNDVNLDAVIMGEKYKIGVFNLHTNKDRSRDVAGTYRYGLDSTTLLFEKNNYMVGYNHSQIKYVTGTKNKINSIYAGHSYYRFLDNTGLEYRRHFNGILSYNSIERGEKHDDFLSYSVNMRNELVKELDIPYLTYSEFALGLKTSVFGHDKITETGANLAVDRNIEVKRNLLLSNEIKAGVLLNKSYELNSKARTGISLYTGYKKELMNVDKWNDEFNIDTGFWADYDKPVEKYKYGKGVVTISGKIELHTGFEGVVSFTADTEGETMFTGKLIYKF